MSGRLPSLKRSNPRCRVKPGEHATGPATGAPPLAAREAVAARVSACRAPSAQTHSVLELSTTATTSPDAVTVMWNVSVV
jgi:hypothetical protein